MKKIYSSNQKQSVLNRYTQGESVTSIHRSTGISRNTVYSWIKTFKKEEFDSKKINLRDIHILKQSYERQKKIIEILKRSPCPPSASLSERYAVIMELSNEYSETLLCDALSVAKGSYYNFKLRGKKGHTVYDLKKQKMTPVIEQIYNENHQIFGASKIHAILKDRGYAISEKTVADIMHKNGWFSIRPCSKKLYLQNEERRQNILNQQFNVSHPNEVWVSDVTYFRYNNKMYYICVILDLFARKIIGYKVSKKNSTQLTKSTFKAVYEKRHPSDILFHSDQGANYTSKSFTTYLRELNVRQSFSNPGTPYDNSVMESFFKSLKSEKLYRTEFTSERKLREAIDSYMDFYNNKRPHHILSNQTPDAYEERYYSNHKD